MKISVIGASKGTGALAVKEALARGHEVTAFARSPEKLVLEHPKLTRLVGDFHQRASVDEAVRGHDAVIITASVSSLKAFKERPDYFSLGTGYAIEAMKTHGVRRLVILSALGVGDSLAQTGFLVRKLMVEFILKAAFVDHERQEELVMKSGLDWVIARPGRLTDGPALKRYAKKTGADPVSGAIARADVADFLVEATEADTWVAKAVQLGAA